MDRLSVMHMPDIACPDSGYKFNQWFDMVWMEKMIGEHNAEPKEVWG